MLSGSGVLNEAGARAGVLDDALDDYSADFSSVRSKLATDEGERYIGFVRTLRPNFFIVYRDIAVGYALIAASLALTIEAPSWGIPNLIAAPIGALLIGYWLAYLFLFLHEGAHYNLAPSKRRSDQICNALISWLFGTSVVRYRPIHFEHHRSLGTQKDTEFTYFYQLNLLFLIRAGLGIRAVEVVISRKVQASSQIRGGRIWLLVGLVLHGIIVGTCVLLNVWWGALAWIAGVIAVFPFFGAVRQLLEHRSGSASRTADYTCENHGAFTRMFGSGVFASTFGAAGFNRHLLHHWEPQVSYSNLHELETFLRRTEMRSVISRRTTTYLDTFRKLFSVY